MRTETINIYKFAELSEAAQKVALEQCAHYNVDYEWWEFIDEDAETIGLKITGFDLERNKHAAGEFIHAAGTVAELITKHHGPNCETYKLAETFVSAKDALEIKLIAAQESGYESDESIIEGEIEDLESEFLSDLLSAYANMLEQEYEYRISEATIIETIEANEYEFTEDGKRYKKTK